MYIVLLKLSSNKSQAGQFMEAHNEWIKRGIDQGVFLLVGTLQPKLGGAILAHDVSAEALQERINEDPFVKEQIVSAEIMEISPALADQRLNFLLN